MGRLENLAYSGQDGYRKCKTDVRWRRLYNFGPRNLSYRNNAGHEGLLATTETMPCHFCGIVLPLGLIQVEHVIPKGTAETGAAVLKCFHSLGANLTTAAAHGRKNAQAVAIANANNNPVVAAALTPIEPQYRFGAWSAKIPAADAGLRGRYTLTDKGRTFLTLCGNYYGLAAISLYCVNNLLNLVPACAMCNGPGGKGTTVHAFRAP